MSRSSSMARRAFLQQCASAASGVVAGGLFVWPLAAARREPLRIAAIGVGNRGEANLLSVRNERVVALCDVDRRYLEERAERFPDARRYRDYRELFDRESLDAVVVSTPDHTHAPVALDALARGLHVYLEKPLAATVAETRRLADAARRLQLVTQTGNQHHASRGYRRAVRIVRAGVLGEVRRAYAWTDRPFWPQGRRERASERPVPGHLEWDLWLNAAPWRPYGDGYHPADWRGCWDFGAGALGDRGPHQLDPAVEALELSLPTRVVAESSEVTAESPPEWSVVKFEFPARGELPPLALTWYDGGKTPDLQALGVRRPPPNGLILEGDRAALFIPDMGGDPRLVPLPGRDPPRLPPDDPAASAPLDHVDDWLDACKTGRPARYDFSRGAVLTEICLIGNLALRTGRPIDWDAKNGRPIDCPAALPLLDRTYRTGWAPRSVP